MNKLSVLLSLILALAGGNIVLGAVTPVMNAPKTVCTSLTGNQRFATMNARLKGGTAATYKWTVASVPAGQSYNVLYGTLNSALANNPSISIEFLHAGTYTATAQMVDTKGVSYTVTSTIEVKDCEIEVCKGQNISAVNFTEDFGQTTKRIALDPARGSIQYVPDLTSSAVQDNYYCVYTDPAPLFPNIFISSGDHTTNTNGAMLIVNCNYEPMYFYSRKVKGLCAGAVYNFGAWLKNINTQKLFETGCSSGYQYVGVSFEILNAADTNSVLASYPTYDISPTLHASPSNRGWQLYGGSFKTPANVDSVVLRIRNNNSGGCGNDIAIDDISFAYCSPFIYSFFDGQVDQLGGEYTMCAGAATNLTSKYTPADYFTKPQYFWQYSDDGVNWITLSGDADGVTGSNTSVLHFAEDALLLRGDPVKITKKYFRLQVYEDKNTTSCAAPSEIMEVTLLPNPKIIVSESEVCTGDTVWLKASGGFDSYTWAAPLSVTADSVQVVPTTTGTYSVTGRKDYGSGRTCYRTGEATVLVDDNPQVSIQVAGPDNICRNTPVTLSIDDALSQYDILWGDSVTTTTVRKDTPTVAGVHTYPVTVTNGACIVTASKNITVTDIPVANAGADMIKQCHNGTFSMKAMLGADETGQWTIAGNANGAVITKTADPMTTITGLTDGKSVTLIWTVRKTSNSVCASSDTLLLTNVAAPTTAQAGPDQKLCNVTSFTLAANAPAAGTGAWTTVYGTHTVADTSSPSSTITATPGDSIRLVWMVSNDICSPSTDTITLVSYKLPPAAVAGPDQKQCNVTSFALAATAPAVGTGGWSTVYGTHTVANPTSPASTITVAPGDSVRLVWTVSNGSCAANTDTVTLVSYIQPSAAVAGTDQKLCNVTSFTLAANKPAAGTGRWTTIYGGKTVANATSPTSTITVVPGDSVVLRWTVTNGNCTPSTDDVTLVSYAQPTTAAAGPDQKLCNVTSFTLAANNPAAGTGRWTTIYGGKTVANPTSPTSTITVVPGDTIVLRWTITNGNCASSFDDVTLVSYAQPTIAAAGPDQRMCNATSFTLAGNTPAVGTGRWTVVHGTASIAAPSSATSSVTVAAGDSVILRWTISNGACVASTDNVTLVSYRMAAAATAGPDQKLCGVNTFTLNANAASVATATGRWTVVYGSPVISNATDPKATVTVAIGDSVILRWTITNGICAPTNDEVTLVSYQQAAIANAGPDQKLCNVTSFTMGANAPGVATAKGTWTRITGNYTISNVNDPRATVTIAAGDSVVLRWTITNGPCPATSDDVKITVMNKPPVVTFVPAALTVDCQPGKDYTTLFGTPQFSHTPFDNELLIISYADASAVNGCSRTLTRTWTATDRCGAMSSASQTITVVDKQAPVFITRPPADTTVDCNAVPATVNLTAYDSCFGTITATPVETRQNIPGACKGSYLLARSWTATDACGNSSSVSWKITVKPLAAPVFNTPAPKDTTVNCGEIPVAVTLKATAACTGDIITVPSTDKREDLSGTQCIGYRIIRSWTATDDCGNSKTISQIITIRDTTRPVFTIAPPADTVVDCDAIPAAPDMRATDNCSSKVNISHTAIREDIPGACSFRLIRTWTAEDECGNTTTIRQVITTRDTTHPVIAAAPADLVLNCGDAIPAAAVLTATDNCDASFPKQVTSSDDPYVVDECTGYTITRRWRIADTCGNQAIERVQYIKINRCPAESVDLPDTAICRGQQATLNAYIPGATYVWSSGETSASIQAGTQGVYWVKVTKRGCSATDTVKVTVSPPPDVRLSRDTTICPGTAAQLQVTTDGGNIRWINGSTSPSIMVKTPGQYWVMVSRNNCTVRDTVNVRLQPDISLELGPNEEICPGSHITINAANADISSYLWNDGDTHAQKDISSSGKYRLTVTDRFCGRSYQDSLKVMVRKLPVIELGSDTVLCNGKVLRLRTDLNNITSVLWSDGSTGPYLDVKKQGTYSITVYNECGSATDQISVSYTECIPEPVFPNAFTPNSDGLNDRFRPVVRGTMYAYHLNIYNRWGQLIHADTDSQKGWDGRTNGVLVEAGSYIWWATYTKTPGGSLIVLKGAVNVIK